LASGWERPEAKELIRTALILSADHELATSTITVRIAASTGASPYRAITSGLATLEGPSHAGLTERVDSLLDDIDEPAAAERIIAARLRRGEDLPGFGVGIYQDSDPRVEALMSAVRRHSASHRALTLADATIAAVHKLTRQKPHYFFALVSACRAAELPNDAPIAIFAIARTAGWVGHVIEQYSAQKIPRPRARYIGVLPV
jgi:citrate synthase